MNSDVLATNYQQSARRSRMRTAYMHTLVPAHVIVQLHRIHCYAASVRLGLLGFGVHPLARAQIGLTATVRIIAANAPPVAHALVDLM